MGKLALPVLSICLLLFLPPGYHITFEPLLQCCEVEIRRFERKDNEEHVSPSALHLSKIHLLISH